ncbi:MAG: BrnA antitoxin family protein [Terriglobales bacterium]
MTKRRTARPLRRQRTISRLRASADAGEGALARASGRAWYLRPNKKRITLYLDADIVEWFKSAGPGYQTRINRALWQLMKGEIDVSL